jgi:hypothetical protein
MEDVVVTPVEERGKEDRIMEAEAEEGLLL